MHAMLPHKNNQQEPVVEKTIHFAELYILGHVAPRSRLALQHKKQHAVFCSTHAA